MSEDGDDRAVGNFVGAYDVTSSNASGSAGRPMKVSSSHGGNPTPRTEGKGDYAFMLPSMLLTGRHGGHPPLLDDTAAAPKKTAVIRHFSNLWFRHSLEKLSTVRDARRMPLPAGGCARCGDKALSSPLQDAGVQEPHPDERARPLLGGGLYYHYREIWTCIGRGANFDWTMIVSPRTAGNVAAVAHPPLPRPMPTTRGQGMMKYLLTHAQLTLAAVCGAMARGLGNSLGAPNLLLVTAMAMAGRWMSALSAPSPSSRSRTRGPSWKERSCSGATTTPAQSWSWTWTTRIGPV